MPTYEYECAKCRKVFEVYQQMSDALLKKCPTCKSTRMKRLIGSGSGIIFKGTGFYETDYKRKPQPKAAEPKTAADSKPSATPPATAPSKAADK